MDHAEKVWQAALGELEMQMTRATFNTWLKPTTVISWDQDDFVLGVPNAYIKDWLENRLYVPIKRTLSGIVNRPLNVQFIVWNEDQGIEQTDELPLLSQPQARPPQNGGKPHDEASNGNGNGNGYLSLNARYTFDTFIVGSSNRLAHAAALAVSDSPATAYNPLFLYGGVGLGKTHLLHAIGHSSQAQNLKVLYVSSEQFTNDLINAIRTQNTEKFRAKYRNTDVLLIDDIQFIAGKESTQEEFFHTFNTLHAANKQIVLTSDRPPKSIPTLEERLRSRFEWGLIADIQPPDLETRIAILQSKAASQPVTIPKEVIALIAQRVISNIRELEGALNKIVAYIKLTQIVPSIETLDSCLGDLIESPKTLDTEYVLQVVAKFYHLDVGDLIGPRRSKELVRPRQIAMYLARQETNASLPEIGRLLGDRDHTTILYGISKIEGLLEQDNNLRREVMTIQEQLYSQTK